MNLKPFRDYSEHEVVNLYAAEEGNLSKGTFVSLVSFDPDNHSSYGPTVPLTPNFARQNTYQVNARVRAATANTGVLGMTLFDVKTTLAYPFGTPTEFADPVRLAEQQIVPSGQAVPIVKRGMFEVMGFAGTPYPGAAAVIVGTGQVGVAAAGTTPRVGTWLSSSGKDGGAILQVSCI